MRITETYVSHGARKDARRVDSGRAISKILQDDVVDEFNVIGVESRRTRDMATPQNFECTPNLVLNARRIVLKEHSNSQPDGSTAARLSLTLGLTHSSNTSPERGSRHYVLLAHPR